MKKIIFLTISLVISLGMQAQTNVARGAVYVSSNIMNGPTEVPKIYDGDYTDNSTHSLIVNSSTESSKYFIIDLKKAAAITSINFYFGSMYPYSYSIYNSMDNYSSPLCSGQCSSTMSIISFTFPYGINSSRYLKLVLNGTGGAIHFSLKEFEVYANESYISYTYDLAGNRTKRELKTLILKSAKVENKNSASKDTIPDKKFDDELTGHKISIFPIPTKGQLNIEITNLKPDEVTSAQVFDLNGQQIMKINNIASGYIDFSDKPGGIYILRIFIGNEKTEWKIVKE